MKNTPEVRRLFEQMSDIAAHLTSGYRSETMTYSNSTACRFRNGVQCRRVHQIPAIQGEVPASESQNPSAVCLSVDR